MKLKIREFVEENSVLLDEDKVDFLNSDNLIELGYVDSLFLMNLITFLEVEFKVIIPIEDLDINNFYSIDMIVEYVQREKN